jgi:hypothetical protein
MKIEVAFDTLLGAGIYRINQERWRIIKIKRETARNGRTLSMIMPCEVIGGSW